MTSANTVNFTIYKDGIQVGSHSQNVMCMRCNDGLEQFTPAEDFKISAWGYDEDEEEWEDDSDPITLAQWLLLNPAEITFKKFKPEERVKVRRQGLGTILSVLPRERHQFSDTYIVKLDKDSTEVPVVQSHLLPAQ